MINSIKALIRDLYLLLLRIVLKERCVLSPFYGLDLSEIVIKRYSNISEAERKEIEVFCKTSGGDLFYDAQDQYSGFYNIDGSWVVVNRVDYGYSVLSGHSWIIGGDGQLHSPTSYKLITVDEAQVLGGLTKLWYPHNMTYDEWHIRFEQTNQYNF